MSAGGDNFLTYAMPGAGFKVAFPLHRCGARGEKLPVCDVRLEQLLAGRAGATFTMETVAADEVIRLADVGAPGHRANEDVDEVHR